MKKVNNDNVTIKNARFFLDGYKEVMVSINQKATSVHINGNVLI